MKIVIELDEILYGEFLTYGIVGLDVDNQIEISKAIRKGTPLPEHHGRIGDLDAVMNDICNSINEMTKIGIGVDSEYLWRKLNDAIDNAPTIIEGE